MSKPVDVTCADVLDRLDAWIDGDLEPAEAGVLEAHMERCTACEAERRLAEEIRATLRGLPELELPDRVMKVVRAETAPTIGERVRGLLDTIGARPVPAGAAVAAIVLFIFAVVPLRQSETPPRYSAEEVERAAEETKLALAYVGGIARYAERQARHKVLSDDAVSGTLREISRSIEWTGAAVSSAPATTKLPKRIDEGSS
jgi:anti-sigma factor RsiW